MTLMLLVAGCVSPSTFRVFVAILTMVNTTWVANLAIFSGVALPLGSSIISHSLLEKNRHTLSRFQISRRTSLCFEKLLKILGALLLQRNTCALNWPRRPVSVRHSRQSRAFCVEQITQQERALNRAVDQFVDASIPQPQEESLENLGRSRSAEKYVHIVLAI